MINTPGNPSGAVFSRRSPMAATRRIAEKYRRSMSSATRFTRTSCSRATHVSAGCGCVRPTVAFVVSGFLQELRHDRLEARLAGMPAGPRRRSRPACKSRPRVARRPSLRKAGETAIVGDQARVCRIPRHVQAPARYRRRCVRQYRACCRSCPRAPSTSLGLISARTGRKSLAFAKEFLVAHNVCGRARHHLRPYSAIPTFASHSR